ncbi:MAG: hypothetical protein IJJ33_09760 [Victivallales bacterium]|nr:hypothetical protein [Victivallales bacterium]
MDKESKRNQMDADTRAYLAKIRRTVAESQALISQVELRRAETDRMLESQGLTRAQVESMQFTPEQVAAVNKELRRRGLPPLEDVESLTAPSRAEHLTGKAAEANFDPSDSREDLGNRRRKLNAMMNKFRL